MKNFMIKRMVLLTTVFCASLVHAQELPKSLDSSKSVTLISRYTGGDYVTASYSFRFMSQNVNITRNNWEVECGEKSVQAFGLG